MSGTKKKTSQKTKTKFLPRLSVLYFSLVTASAIPDFVSPFLSKI